MADKLKGKALIAQSGGPTGVINASLVAAVKETRQHPEITAIYGSRYGLQGALKQDLINLGIEGDRTLDFVAKTSGSALGSARKKPEPEECVTVFRVCKAHDIRYLFYIGGNDSAEAADIINKDAKQAGYELHIFHIPKTIDNDLKFSDHTPGYGSAARYIALEFMGFTNDQRSLPGIHIVKTMGRKNGSLTSASVLGKRAENDAPHLVYIPEYPVSIDDFVKDVLITYKKYGTCVVAVSEGAKTTEGEELVTVAARELYGKSELLPKDSHGNIQLSGFGVDLDYLLCKVIEAGEGIRVRTDRETYNQRCHPTIVSEVDRKEAAIVGRQAVIEAIRWDSDGSIAIKRTGYGPDYGIKLFVTPLESVAKGTKSMPEEFYDPAKKMPTDAFRTYAQDLVGELPEQGRLKRYAVEKKAI